MSAKSKALTAATPAQSEEMVLPPAGKLPISKVHHIPKGGRLAHVGNEIHLIDANNNVVFGAVVPDIPDSDSKSRDEEETGWTTYAHWTNDGSLPIDTFLTTWIVPPEPITDSGQTIFLFSAIQPPSSDTPAIIQPVLQWGKSGAGGGSYWSIASWYLIGKNKLGFASDLTEVNVGDSLEAVIKLTSYSDTTFNYKSSFAGVNSSFLTVTGVRELVYVGGVCRHPILRRQALPKGLKLYWKEKTRRALMACRGFGQRSVLRPSS